MGIPVKGESLKSGAAPATVSGEPAPQTATGRKAGKARQGPRPASQETCRRTIELERPPVGWPRRIPLTTRTDTASAIGRGERTDALVAALVAFLLGVGLVYTTGFSHPSTIHNAAHDTRHALSFPCH